MKRMLVGGNVNPMRANYNHAMTILEEIDKFFREDTPVHSGALLFDDDRTLAQHVKEVLVNDRPWLYP